MHVRGRRRGDSHRLLVLRDRDADRTGMQMQARLAETRTVTIDIVADDGPALSRGMNAQLVGAAGDRFHREPGEPLAAPEHPPVRDRLLPLGIRLLPPAALGVEA